MHDQDREPLIGRIGKLLCLNTENPCVRAWPCTLEINNSKCWIYMGVRGILPFNLTYGHKTWQSGDLLSGALNHKITWTFHFVTKTIISLLPECPWLPNLERWWHTLRGCKPENHLMFWSYDFARSRVEWKPLYLHYQLAHGDQAWHYDNWPWLASRL